MAKVTAEEVALWKKEQSEGKSVYQVAKDHKRAYRVVRRALKGSTSQATTTAPVATSIPVVNGEVKPI